MDSRRNEGLRTVRVKDVGQGNVLVRGDGNFMPGLRIRVGPTMLDGSVSVLNDRAFEFVASAKALIAQRAFLVGRDGRQWELARAGQVKVEDKANNLSALSSKIGPGLAKIVPEGAFPLPSGQSTMDGNTVKPHPIPGGHMAYFATVPETKEFATDSKVAFQVPNKFIMTVTGKEQSVTIKPNGSNRMESRSRNTLISCRGRNQLVQQFRVERASWDKRGVRGRRRFQQE